MARARNVKPSLFKNELLGSEDPLLTLLFVSLWTLADKEGRLEDRPLRIKAETFPYRENIDINGYLTQLVSLGFIWRYKVDGENYIQVIEFVKHQSPHSTEKASTIPSCPIECRTKSAPYIILPLNNESASVNANINVLIPDSSITDSLITDSKANEPNGSLSDSTESDAKVKRNTIPYQKIVDLYHEHLQKCPRVEILNSKRKYQIGARWNSGELDTIDSWEGFFSYCAQSKFLVGAVDPSPGRNRFVADLEWLTKESNYTKIVEGKYHG